MAPSKTLSQSAIEIEERDQAHKLVATYLHSPEAGAGDKSRIDIVVCVLNISRFRCKFIHGVNQTLMFDR